MCNVLATVGFFKTWCTVQFCLTCLCIHACLVFLPAHVLPGTIQPVVRRPLSQYKPAAWPTTFDIMKIRILFDVSCPSVEHLSLSLFTSLPPAVTPIHILAITSLPLQQQAFSQPLLLHAICKCGCKCGVSVAVQCLLKLC